jgi:septum formation topological specificity factor MinE
MIFVDANVLLEVIQKRVRARKCELILSNDKDKAISILRVSLKVLVGYRFLMLMLSGLL